MMSGINGDSDPHIYDRHEVGNSQHRVQRKGRRQGRTIIGVAGWTLVSRLLGFLRLATIAQFFGAGGEADVLHLVFNIPNNLRKLMAEGALSSAFIPALSAQVSEARSNERSRLSVQRLMGLQCLVWVPLLAICILFPRFIVELLLDFRTDWQNDLASNLFRIIISYSLLISIAAVLMGLLHAHGYFAIPAATPILFSLCVIASIWIWNTTMGIFAVAIGVLAGGILQVLFQLPVALRMGYSIIPRFGIHHPDFRPILRRWLPVSFSASIFIINQQAALFFASGLEQGSGSALANALVFFQLPFGILGVSIITVLFPLMSKQAAQGDRAGLLRSLYTGLSRQLLLLVPAALLLAGFSREVIAVALQRGEFTAEATVLTAKVLRWYCWGLFSVAGFQFMQRFFYASLDYRTPIAASILTVSLDIVLSLWLKETQLRVAGLAAANSLAFTLGFLFLLWRATRFASAKHNSAKVAGEAADHSVGSRSTVERAGPRLLAIAIARMAPAIGIIVAYLLAYRQIAGDWWQAGGTVANIARIGAAGLVGLALALAGYRLTNLGRLLRER